MPIKTIEERIAGLTAYLSAYDYLAVKTGHDHYTITPAISKDRLKELVAQADPCAKVFGVSEDDSKTTAYIHFMSPCISVELSAGFSFKLSDVEEDLEIEWSEVSEWYIKWMTLYITMNNGDDHEYDLNGHFDLDNIDYKRPKSAEIEYR